MGAASIVALIVALTGGIPPAQAAPVSCPAVASPAANTPSLLNIIGHQVKRKVHHHK